MVEPSRIIHDQAECLKSAKKSISGKVAKIMCSFNQVKFNDISMCLFQQTVAGCIDNHIISSIYQASYLIQDKSFRPDWKGVNEYSNFHLRQ